SPAALLPTQIECFRRDPPPDHVASATLFSDRYCQGGGADVSSSQGSFPSGGRLIARDEIRGRSAMAWLSGPSLRSLRVGSPPPSARAKEAARCAVEGRPAAPGRVHGRRESAAKARTERCSRAAGTEARRRGRLPCRTATARPAWPHRRHRYLP